MAKHIQTPVFQFGTSRFLQAHADLFIHEAAVSGEAAGPTTVMAISGSAAGRARLQALAHEDGYPVVIRGLEAGTPVEREIRVKSIRRALDAETDWPELVALFADRRISSSQTPPKQAFRSHPIWSST
jgi:tagaturonate reductase